MANLDEAVELVKDRLDACRPTLRTQGRFKKRPVTDPTVLSEPLLAVLRLMADNKGCTAIADALGKNKSTISRQMAQIERRLAVHSSEEAAERGKELGLI